MKIQCDVCENSPAAVICCADEAALCAKCDVEVHAANKLASKHQRLLLQRLSHKLPPCDICQEKTAFIFCVEDRTLFCKECDEPIHSANSLTANHQRFLATGIRVALCSSRSRETLKQQLGPKPQMPNTQQNTLQIPSQHISGVTSPSWAVDELLHLSDYESCDKKEQLEFSELEWLTNMNLFGEQVEPLAAAEVPQLPGSLPINSSSCRPAQLYKKPRIGTLKEEEEDEHFTVPDLGLKCDCKPC